MLNLMSLFCEKENLDLFFEKHKKDKEKIFGEIYSFLGGREFESKEDFTANYMELLSREMNQKKILPSGLILQIRRDIKKLELTDKDSSFHISIECLKKIKILDKKANTQKTKYIISETYYSYYFETIKKNKMKYKYKNNLEESSLYSDNFDSNIIYNKKLEYISMEPDFNQIYTNIYNILKKERQLDIITANDFFNDYRILNFPEVKKEYASKIKFKDANFNDYCYNYKYLCYNKKIGLTFNIQRYLIRLYQQNIKHFYLNIDFLYKEADIKKIRNYIFFYLSFLFSINEKDLFQDFVEKNVINMIYSYKGEKLILHLLELLHQKFGENYKLYVDNIKSRTEFKIIEEFMNTFEKERVIILIQINKQTLYCLSDIKFRVIENIESTSSINDELEYYIPLSLKIIDKQTIKNNYSEKLKYFFDKFDYESYLYLLKVKYLINAENFHLYKLIDIDSFLEFLLVKIKNQTVYNIRLRNDYIKKLFNEYYIDYIVKFKNVNNQIFFEISKTEEGINFERQIIFDLIIKNLNIERISVDKIFSIETLPNIIFKSNQEYLFIQNNSNAPYYDIAYLYYFNGNIVLNVCQIGINKPIDELKKLDQQFIFFDLFYLCQKLEFERGVKINKLQFSLITTYNAYKEYVEFKKKKILSTERKYKNFKKMKEYCNKNNFIFLIFNTKNSEFYRFDNNNNLIKTTLKCDYIQYNIQKIFNESKDIENTKKIDYNFDPNNPKLLGGINLPDNFDKEYLNNEYKFKIIKNIAIYKRNIFVENNDQIKTKKNIKKPKAFKEKSQDKILKDDDNDEEENGKKVEEKDPKKRPRNKSDEEKKFSKNKKKKIK